MKNFLFFLIFVPFVSEAPIVAVRSYPLAKFLQLIPKQPSDSVFFLKGELTKASDAQDPHKVFFVGHQLETKDPSERGCTIRNLRKMRDENKKKLSLVREIDTILDLLEITVKFEVDIAQG